MHPIFYFEYILHTCSFLTAIVVVLKINIYDKINPVAKICISMIYSSVFISDLSYSYAVSVKSSRGQLVFVYSDVINTESTPIRSAIFLHELSTWIYVWGVVLASTERLLNGHFNINLHLSSSLLFFSPLIVLIIFGSSYFCTTLLLSGRVIQREQYPIIDEHQQKADVMIISSQVFGVSALVYTIYLNQKQYKNGIGMQTLEQRYQSAYVYKFNRSLLKSLIGEVLFRAAGFSCIAVLTIGHVYSDPGFGWLSFAYHNTIPVGSILCPYFIVLRHVNIREIFSKPQNKIAAVNDLNGHRLALRETADEHFASLHRQWNEKLKGASSSGGSVK